MLTGVLIIFIIYSLFLVRKKHLYSPWSITLIVWTVLIALFLFLNHGLYPTTGYFETSVLLWVTSFCFSSLISFLIFKNNSKPKYSNYNQTAFRIMYWIAIICIPLSAYLTYKYVMANALSDNIFFNLRYNATSRTNDDSILKYTSFIALIPLLAECNTKNINKKKLILLYVLNILLALTSMAKTALFTIIISSIFILIYNKKIKSITFIYVFAFFIFLTILFQGLRSFSGDIDSIEIEKTLSTYVLSPISAFDLAARSTDFTLDGSNTFRFFYKIAELIGFNVEAKDTIQEFVKVPTPTNVYTIFYQYYCDFGNIGIIILGLINGFIYGSVYALINSKPYIKLFYSYLVVTLFLQFFNELFWVVFSSVIQIGLLSYLIYYKVKN